ncbi:DUF4006 family protein [uncultured Campylobacter sp.]|uniref:DUF4006 family protein n=1 Tax=uncultured Campylobacter sp. TaxID=218934 RepID=UPI0026364A99|nr:DUF4006 family protein [uncultured Campylobacter sp.]
MENQNRNVFGLHGVTGMLIATVLLLSILVGLTIWGIKVQQEVADKPYTLQNPQDVHMKSNMDVAKKTMVIKE